MARLILATSEGQQAIELRTLNSLGRHPNNSIQLLDKIVSKEHCLVEQRGEHFVLRDLGSLNGTFINAQRVNGEQLLRHGDEIALGSTRARFDDGSGPVMGVQPGPGALLSGHPPPPQSAWQPPQQQQQPPHQQGPQSLQPGPQGPQGPQSGVGAGAGAGAGVSSPRRQQASVPPAASSQQPPVTYRASVGSMPAASQPYGQQPPSLQQPQSGPMPPPSAYSTASYGMPPPSTRGSMPGQRPTAPSPGPAGQQGVGLPSQLPPPQGRPLPAPLGPPPQRAFGTRVDMSADNARAIGTQIAAASAKGFAPFDQVRDPQQLRMDYERLRISYELSREIALEHDLDMLLDKILKSLLKFANADRAVILLLEDGMPQPRAAKRRDGTDAPIQVSTTILNHVISEKAAVLTHDAALDFASSKGKSMILNRITSAMVVPLIHDDEVLGAVWLDSESLATFQQKDLELVTAVANQAALFIENTLLARKIEHEIITRERFSRLLSPNVAEQVMRGNLEIKKGGLYIDECTVFNSDIRGFTRMSEGAKAEDMVELLNEYFELMVETIFNYEGTLDKFMGDGIMAFWGSPAQHPDDAIRAVQCALDQMDVLGRFNRKRVEGGEPPLAIGMGIHTGPLVAGYVGSSKALSYTVIGDTANTSARLCGIALSGQIIVSEGTLHALGDRFKVEELAPAHLKGKEKPLRIFNVIREKASAAVARVG
jgi:adenylate cyclase